MLAEGDHTLSIDFDNPLSVDTLVHLLKRSKDVTLVEMYPQRDRCCVRGPEGNFEHELLIPLTKLRTQEAPEPTMSMVKPSAFQQMHARERVIVPGNDWHYLKLYGGSTTLDELLIGEIGPLLSRCTEDGAVKLWFFVRYSDPDNHLRLRFNTTNSDVVSHITHIINSLVSNSKIWKIQNDTYRREVERYGGRDGVLDAERIFWADSEAAIAILSNLDRENEQDDRWRVALLGIDTLLADFDFDLDQKLALLDRLRRSYADEFALSPSAKKTIGDRYRSERGQLRRLLNQNVKELSKAESLAIAEFARRSKRVDAWIDRLLINKERDCLDNDIMEIAASCIHMHVNRFIRSSARMHEMVLYEFLYRLYLSDKARGQKDSNVQECIRPPQFEKSI
jgi:thiopeptide-type bacteriocin biosynthesis protein